MGVQRVYLGVTLRMETGASMIGKDVPSDCKAEQAKSLRSRRKSLDQRLPVFGNEWKMVRLFTTGLHNNWIEDT